MSPISQSRTWLCSLTCYSSLRLHERTFGTLTCPAWPDPGARTRHHVTDPGSWRNLPPGTVSLKTYSAVQLAQRFAKRRTTPAIIDDFQEPAGHHRHRFGKALVGIRESQARKEIPSPAVPRQETAQRADGWVTATGTAQSAGARFPGTAERVRMTAWLQTKRPPVHPGHPVEGPLSVPLCVFDPAPVGVVCLRPQIAGPGSCRGSIQRRGHILQELAHDMRQ